MSPPAKPAGGIVAPLNAARTAQRAVPTVFVADADWGVRPFLWSESQRDGCRALPLPGGEGRGEGERLIRLRNISAASFLPPGANQPKFIRENSCNSFPLVSIRG